jgi:hypothetical protein
MSAPQPELPQSSMLCAPKTTMASLSIGDVHFPIFEDQNGPWFAANAIAEALQCTVGKVHKSYHHHKSKYAPGETRVTKVRLDKEAAVRPHRLFSEAGLIRVIQLTSHNPVAARLRDHMMGQAVAWRGPALDQWPDAAGCTLCPGSRCAPRPGQTRDGPHASQSGQGRKLRQRHHKPLRARWPDTRRRTCRDTGRAVQCEPRLAFDR